MENAVVIGLFIVGFALFYQGVKLIKQPYRHLVEQAPISIYEKLINEGVQLADDLRNCKEKPMHVALVAYRKINTWDEKVQRLTQFKVVK